MVRCQRCQRRLAQNAECPDHGRPSVVIEIVDPGGAPPSAPPAGWTLGAQIATGGTAAVYVVERAGATAILKWAKVATRDVLARFAVDADVLRTVGPPATPALIDAGSLDGKPYLLMDHLPGETLAAWMARFGDTGPIAEILAILVRLAGALDAVHRAGYVHRDLKPENIVIGPQGVRLLDFGLAKPLRTVAPDLTQIGAVVGTVHYLAPEQIRTGGIVDQRADIYSFGAVAFEMFTGRPLFVGERRALEYKHQVVRPPSIREWRDVPAELDELIDACLAKQAEARPQTAEQLRARLAGALGALGTLRGQPTRDSGNRPVGRQDDVVLAWIEGGDPVAIARAIADVQGIVVRTRGAGVLAAFPARQHEAPLSVAAGACRDLLDKRCRAVLHATTALIRRTAQGKLTAYGADLEHVETWLPRVPFTGVLLTAAAAQLSGASARPAGDVPGLFREANRDRTDATDVQRTPSLVGRSELVAKLADAAAARAPALIGIFGAPGMGKTRVLDAVVERVRAAGREVVAFRVRRRFDGDRADDHRLCEALGEDTPAAALASAAARGAVVAIDNADRLSTPLRALLVPEVGTDDAGGRPLRAPTGESGPTRLLASEQPMFEVLDGTTGRIGIELPPLAYADVDRLLREQLRPARLIPDVLIERLAIRGIGNPGLLVALARDIKSRGAIRRAPAGDDWYVAADELDTLLAPPGTSWLAVRAYEDLPVELAPIVRMGAGLGPRFCAEEVVEATGIADCAPRLAQLVKDGVFGERGGWFEFADAALQDALYDHVLGERELVHGRAYRYWLGHRSANMVGWLARLAYHGSRCGETETAVACWIALARVAGERGEHDQAALLHARAMTGLASRLPAVVRDGISALDGE